MLFLNHQILTKIIEREGNQMKGQIKFQAIVIIIIKRDRFMEGEQKLSLEKCNVHQFKFKVKAVLSLGSCQILKEENRFSLHSKSTSLIIPFDSGLIRLSEANYSTYLLTQDNTVVSISLPATQQQQIVKFETFVLQNLVITNFYDLAPQEDKRNIIATNCPLGPSAQPLGLNNDDTLQNTGKAIGNVFGTVSAIFHFEEFNRDARNTVTRFEDNNLGNDESSGWGKFKMKCAELNQKIGQGLKPVSDACKKTTSDIGYKFDTTNNSVIKGIREWSRKTESALNSGYREGEEVQRHRIETHNTQKESRIDF